MEKYDFEGWATRNNVVCSDGRIIRKDAFKHNDGEKVPLVWNHRHGETFDVLGHALLENREEGVWARCAFNDTESGKNAKICVEHGDINQLSIYANQLKQQGPNVMHGTIREVSLVLAGANPKAYIESVIRHADGLEYVEESDEGLIFTGENIILHHSEDSVEESIEESTMVNDGQQDESSNNKKEDKEMEDNERSLVDIFEEMTDEQKEVVYAVMDDDDEEEEGGNVEMKHNVFDNDTKQNANILTHSDEEAIMSLAKDKSVGTFQNALRIYADEHLAHGFDEADLSQLFPEYELTNPGAPEMITRDQSWVDSVLAQVHKSPISRIRTRQAKVDAADIRALGYEKKKEKKLIGSIRLVNRTTDPQTIYVKDKIERDDMIDITDFDAAAYQKRVMRMALNEELATAILIGDGREEGEENKIYETHVRSVWNDDDLYTIHADVDIEAARAELQGSNTNANFGENYIYAEAIISAALFAREKYKGSGSLTFYCTPHLLNVMLLARDLNGRRIYESKTDLAAALNVTAIHTVEQFENKTRKTEDGDTKKLLGLFVNLADYQLGSTKGGQITNFEDFDIDFNQYKYLMETRVSGALTKIFSAIALEEPVENVAG